MWKNVKEKIYKNEKKSQADSEMKAGRKGGCQLYFNVYCFMIP